MQKSGEAAIIPDHTLQFSSGPEGYVLKARQRIPLPRERVFQFFAEPRNLGRIIPPWMSFQMLDADRVKMEAGTRIRYIIRWLKLPPRWTTIMSSYQPPEIFEDMQESGPYAGWDHRADGSRGGGEAPAPTNISI